MKGRRYKTLPGVTLFDLTADIIPGVGAGGVTFKNVIGDFEYILINPKPNETNIVHQIDDKYFFMNFATKNGEFEIEVDLFTGKISSMSCAKGYRGKLTNGIGIGSSINDCIKSDLKIYFDLDHSFFVSHPFDGLVIYAPAKLVDSIWSAECDGKPIPDFRIETIEILDMDFAKEHFSGTLIAE